VIDVSRRAEGCWRVKIYKLTDLKFVLCIPERAIPRTALLDKVQIASVRQLGDVGSDAPRLDCGSAGWPLCTPPGIA
jgi:hypothetical protein